MILKKLVAAVALCGAVLSVQAQDIHFTQFNLSPLTINPAFTGMHSGLWRASGIYRTQWASVTAPYKTTGLSFDMPIAKDIGEDDNLSFGVNVFTDQSGDGNLLNNTVMGSLAYHKFFGQDAKTSLSVGMQGGYSQKSIDLARLYFADQFQNGGYQPGVSLENLNLKTSSWLANVGLNWGHRISNKFGYSIGAAAFNLNQPLETLQKRSSTGADVGLGMRITSQIGAVWMLSDRISLAPAFLYQTQSSATEMLVGSEVKYILGDPEIRSVASSVFLGGWTRLGDATLVTGGVEFKGFRVGVGYDMTNSKLAAAAGGVGSFELGVSYVQPNPLDFARRVFFPCLRF
jgi:type IX secretion system PorP/SprF family membrane protein